MLAVCETRRKRDAYVKPAAKIIMVVCSRFNYIKESSINPLD